MTTLILLAVTVAASLAAWNNSRWFETGIMRPYWAARGAWHMWFSYGFLHADWNHLIMNGFTLFFFGPVIESVLGTERFLLLYLSAIPISVAPTFWRHRADPDYATVGASGAVSAVLFAFMLYFPFEKIYLMFIPIGIPAWIAAFGFVGYSVWAGKKAVGRVNHDAHLAGALYGWVFVLIVDPTIVDHLRSLIGLR